MFSKTAHVFTARVVVFSNFRTIDCDLIQFTIGSQYKDRLSGLKTITKRSLKMQKTKCLHANNLEVKFILCWVKSSARISTEDVKFSTNGINTGTRHNRARGDSTAVLGTPAQVFAKRVSSCCFIDHSRIGCPVCLKSVGHRFAVKMDTSTVRYDPLPCRGLRSYSFGRIPDCQMGDLNLCVYIDHIHLCRHRQLCQLQ